MMLFFHDILSYDIWSLAPQLRTHFAAPQSHRHRFTSRRHLPRTAAPSGSEALHGGDRIVTTYPLLLCSEVQKCNFPIFAYCYMLPLAAWVSRCAYLREAYSSKPEYSAEFESPAQSSPTTLMEPAFAIGAFLIAASSGSSSPSAPDPGFCRSCSACRSAALMSAPLMRSSPESAS